MHAFFFVGEWFVVSHNLKVHVNWRKISQFAYPSLHGGGWVFCPIASLTVGFPSLMFFIRTIISLSKTSSLIIPPSSSWMGSSSPILMDLTIFSILLSEPSPRGMAIVVGGQLMVYEASLFEV